MNKSIARNIDTEHIPIQHLCSLLETFALKHSSKQLPDILEQAENAELTYRQFLLELLEIEVKGQLLGSSLSSTSKKAGGIRPRGVVIRPDRDPTEAA